MRTRSGGVGPQPSPNNSSTAKMFFTNPIVQFFQNPKSILDHGVQMGTCSFFIIIFFVGLKNIL